MGTGDVSKKGGEIMATKYEDFLKKKDVTREELIPIWSEFKNDLNTGKIRVAEVDGNGEWQVNKWVKSFILLGMKYGVIIQFEAGYFDKDTLGERTVTLEEKVRTVSPTTSIRDGVYIGAGVTFMPPCYTNIGAYIGEGSMVDSMVLVGSCAQIGKNVHIGAGTIIGGVLEPVGAYPVIVEDNAFIGASSTITEGAIIKQGAVISAGVTITGSTPIYDIVNDKVITANEKGQVIIPEGAVVVPGTRKKKAEGFDVELAVATPIIVKYGSKVELEDALRP